MKILNIYYKNINSLAGEGQVSFDQSPIADSGVFAITGANGSGKTSILDVITLGLYGETFRFDKPAEHIITKQANDSLAQVEFAFNGEKYRSVWQVNRTDVNRPAMSLWQLDDQAVLLADNPAQVRQRVFELTGMDFHKFSKSIILPQGDFAAFLNALDSERLDILEKISGQDFYQETIRQLSKKLKDLQEKQALVNRDLSAIPLVDPETLFAAEQDLLDFQELQVELKEEQSQLQQQWQTLQTIAQLQTQIEQLSVQQQKLTDKIAAQRHDLQSIDDAPDTDAFQQDLELLTSLENELALSQTNLVNFRQELAVLQASVADYSGELATLAEGKNLFDQKQLLSDLKLKLNELKTSLPRELDLANNLGQQIFEKKAALTQADEWLQSHQAEAILVSDFPDIVRLRNLRNEITALSGQQKNQDTKTKKQTATIEKNQLAVKNTQQRLDELQTLIATSDKNKSLLLQNRSLAAWQESLQDQELRVKDFQELYSVASVYQRLSEKKPFFSWFSKKTPETLPDVSDTELQVAKLKTEFESEENIAKALELALGNETLVKRLQVHRSKLVEGKPCYLCGSSVHPYSLKPPADTDYKRALADQRGRLQVLKSTIEHYEKQLVSVNKQHNYAKAKKDYITEKRNEWLFLSNKLNLVSKNLTIENSVLQKELLNAESDELNKIKRLIEDYHQFERDINTAQIEIQLKQALLEKLRDEYRILDANRDEESPEVAAHLQNCKQEEEALTKHLELTLKSLGEKLPGKGKEDAVYDRLNSRRQDYQIYVLRQKGLQEDIFDLQKQVDALQLTIQSHQSQMNALLANMQVEEGAGLHLAIIEKQHLIQHQEQRIQEQSILLESMRRSVSEKLQTLGFADVKALYAMQALIQQQATLQAQYFADNKTLDQLKQQIMALVDQFERAKLTLADNSSLEEVASVLKLLTEKIAIADAEIVSLRSKLEKQQKYQRSYDKLAEQLDQLALQVADYSQQLAEVSDDHPDSRRKLRQLLVNQLLHKANQVLEKINGRYYLRSAESEHGLALEIEDTKQKNLRRLPKTLSGGESFTVSLALALALTDIANNGKAIESLFLDEGFGNLDAEALYQAMTTLESLKLQGKTVGIISHVEAVKKRIKTQITLVKNANGYSQLVVG